MSRAPLCERASLAAQAVRQAVAEEKFPGAVLLVGDGRGPAFLEACGCAQWFPFRRPMFTTTRFDIASLSKLTGPWPGIIRLLDKGVITLETPLGEALPGRPMHPGVAKVTIWNLLTHTGGLHPFMNTHGATREQRVDSLLALPPLHAPGGEPVYSDLSFIFLGEVLAAQTGEPLEKAAARFWRELGMNDTCYNPPFDGDYAATEIRAGCLVPQVGTVHDERSAQLGGVAGHAGVFSTAEDLGRFCAAIARPEDCRVLPPEWVRRSYQNQTREAGGDRGLGWVVYAELGDGRLVGHTGFTGTSIWMDSETGEYAVLLTNRVHPSRANSNLYPVRVAVRRAVFPQYPWTE